MSKRTGYVFPFMVILIIFACSCDELATEPMTALAEPDTIRTVRNMTFEISLESCWYPCGGYGWEFVEDLEKEYIYLLGYKVSPTDTLIGSPYEQKWTYVTRKEGTTSGTLYLWRFLREDREPVEIKNIVLIIE